MKQMKMNVMMHDLYIRMYKQSKVSTKGEREEEEEAGDVNEY